MTGILAETAPGACSAALSGPSLAAEVAAGIPTAVVAAHRDLATPPLVQEWFPSPGVPGGALVATRAAWNSGERLWM